MRWNRLLAVVPALFAALVLGLNGCSPSAPKKDEGEHGHKEAKGEDEHALHGWWCTEHGVPEKECSLCSAAVAKEFKDKGDWCNLHDRAKSQCFICDPAKYERFVAMFKAKHGEDPPRPPASEFKK